MSKKEIINEYSHGFKIHVPELLEEILNNGLRPSVLGALRIPLIIFLRYLDSIAKRATELNDPILNRIMVETALYSVGDPHSEYYDAEKIKEVINKAKEFQAQGKPLSEIIEEDKGYIITTKKPI